MNVHISEAAKARAREAAQAIFGNVRRAHVVLSDFEGREIMTLGPFPCMPGTELKIDIPKPEDLEVF